MESIRGHYEDDFSKLDRDCVEGIVESDASEEADTRLGSALKKMYQLPMNPRPPNKPQECSQEEIQQIENEYLENSYANRSPWTRRAQVFNDNLVFSKADLAIPHFKEVPKDGLVFLDESDHIPIRRGWGICLLGMFAGRFSGKE